MQQITRNVYVETGFPGSNCGFVVTEEGIVMIESPMIPEYALKWREEITRYGKVKYLINTEPHGDHFAGNYYFEGTVVAHEGTRETMLKESIDRFKNMLPPGSPPPDKGFYFRPPTITFSQQLTLYAGKHTFRLINMPGHTPYQIAVFIPEERVVFTSDNVVGNMPFMMQSMPYEWLASLKRLETLEFDHLVPGHGNTGNKSYLPQMTATVQLWIDAVKQAISEGMSVEQAQDVIIQMKGIKLEPDDPRMVEVQRSGIAHLYEVLKGN